MKKRKTILVLVITLCVLVAAYAAIMLFGNKGTNTTAPEQEDMVIYTCASISDIAYTYKDQSLHFVWSDADSVWSYAEDPTFPLKQTKITAMVRNLKSFTVLRLVQQGTDNLSDFGLDDPLCSFTAVTGDGETVSFQIGALNSTTGNYYLHMDGKDAVYLMAADKAAYFMPTRNERGTLDTLPKVDSNTVHDFILTGPDGVTMHFVNLPEGSDSYYTDKQNWFLKAEDGSLTPVYDISIDSMLTELTGVKYDSCLTYRADDAELVLLGLSEPLYTITLDYTATIEEEAEEGQEPKTYTQEESFTLYFGVMFGEGSLCARLDGSDMVGLVKLDSVAATLQTTASSLYLRNVCQLKLDEIESMTAVLNGNTYQIDIQRQAETAADGTKSTTASYTVNGAAADAQEIEAFFTAIASLSAESATDTDPGTAPGLTITFTRDRAKFGSLTMELVPYDTNFDLVRFAGDNSLLVNRRSVENLISLLENL
jgi:hypothetical protein